MKVKLTLSFLGVDQRIKILIYSVYSRYLIMRMLTSACFSDAYTLLVYGVHA